MRAWPRHDSMRIAAATVARWIRPVPEAEGPQGAVFLLTEWRPGVTVYIDAAALEAIDDLRGDATRSEWIRRAIADALAKEARR